MSELTVSEVFGPTVQGEGPSTGQVAAFLRLGLCNLHCRWCDTPYTWDWTGRNGHAYQRELELAGRSTDDVAAQLLAMDAPLVVITGGEPLLQGRHLEGLVATLHDAGRRVEFETNGTRPVPDWAQQYRPDLAWNVSPKLAHAEAGPLDQVLPMDTLTGWARRADARFKFVVANRSQLAEVDRLARHLLLEPGKVWVMPEGRDPSTVHSRLSTLADAVVERRYNLSGRLHVALWGDERGR